MRPAKVTLMSSVSDCVGQFGSAKASGSLALSILYESTPSSFLEVTGVHSVFACSHACKLLPFQLLSWFRLGTWHRKKASLFGLAARARRKRRIRAGGR